MNISHRQLKAFVLLARLRNFSRAAEQMFIAQSGLSMMIRELEGQLGFRLFDRTTRNVSLTKFGTEFLAVAEQNVRNIENTVERVGRSAKDENLRLSISAPPMSCAYLLPPIVAAFEKRYPAVQLHIVDTDLGNITRLVRDGEVDLGLGMFVKPTPGLVRIPLFKFSLALASQSPRFRIGRTPRRWRDLIGLPFINLPPDYPFQQAIDKNLQNAGHSMGPKFTVNLIDTQLGMVAAGRGVAIVPSTVVSACRSRPIQLEPIVDPIIEMEYYELRDRARQLPVCTDDFTDLIRELIPRDVAPLAVTSVEGVDS